jgi:hypothetical protein
MNAPTAAGAKMATDGGYDGVYDGNIAPAKCSMTAFPKRLWWL